MKELRLYEGLVVLERNDWVVDVDELPRQPVQNMDASEALAAFKGLFGVPWPASPEDAGIDLTFGCAPAHSLESVKDYFEQVCAKTICRFLWCEFDRQRPRSHSIPPEFHFCGFDLAIGPFRDSVFSAVLNEVVFGFHNELRNFGSRLNDHLLLPSVDDAIELAKMRDMISQKPDPILETIEDGDYLVPVAIHELANIGDRSDDSDDV